MFKRVGIFLLLFILVCLCTSALAAPDDVLLFTRDETATRNPTVEAAVPVGDTLYMLLRMYEEADSPGYTGCSAIPWGKTPKRK